MKQTLTQRVKKIEKDIRQMSVVLDSHGTDLYHIRNSDPKPYTAMRSTGKTDTEVVEAIKRHNEPEYCECTATITHYHKDESGWWVCDKCGKPSSERPNLTKPQEDIRERIVNVLDPYLGRHIAQTLTNTILQITGGGK